MRINLENRTGDRIEYGIIYGALAVLIVVAARLFPLLDLAPQCAFKKLAGFPCPTCGSTRSIVHLARADFLSAFALNPLVTSGFIIAVCALVYRGATLVFALPRISIALSKHERAMLRILALVIVLVNWLYLVLALQS